MCYTSLIFPVYTQAFEGERVMFYQENTSDKWHVSRYHTIKHCLLLYPMLKSSKKYRNFRDFRKVWKHFKTVLEEFIRFLKVFGKSLESSGN